MKKYNILLFGSLVIYVIISITSFFLISKTTQKNENEYRVEINRIIHSFSNKKDVQNWNSRNYQWIEEVTLLEPNFQKNQLQQFFQEENNHKMVVYPWYQGEELLGYLKFTYRIPQNQGMELVWIVEVSLLILELFILFVLCYIKKRIIRPFHQVSTLPYNLAKGRFHGEVKIEKGKYFKEFLWGMSSLKDTLELSKERELQFMKEKQQMLLSLSHDMKTPIHIMKLYVKALEENLCQDDIKKIEMIHRIGEKTDEMEQYVEEITKSSREEIIDLPVHIEEFYLSDLLSKVLPIYQEQCAIQNIELIVSSYQNCLMKGDINRSQEVLENILENAIKYGDGRKIEISFSEEEYHHLIHISNTGTPVSENEFNHLFDSFFRGKNAKGKTGSGLGLYICRELMRKMDGSIYAEIRDDAMTFVVVFHE